MGGLDAATLEQLQGQFLLWVLIFVRTLAVLTTAPLFSHPGIPVILKASIAALIAIALASTQPPATMLELHPLALIPLLLKEVMLGLLLGFLSSAVVYAARFAGGLLDMDIGFQTALFFDPALGGFPTLVGEFYAFAALVLFFWLDGHHAPLLSLAETLRIAPVTELTLRFPSAQVLIGWMAQLTVLALNIAAPAMAALFLTLWALALLARSAPQINIFLLSFSAKVVVGIGVLALSTPLIVVLLRQALVQLQSDLLTLVRALQP
jgi:flagellar biosynthetic protein FliR